MASATDAHPGTRWWQRPPWRRAKPSAEEPTATPPAAPEPTLRERVDAALVAADDAVRASRSELACAAQLLEPDVLAPFGAAVHGAQAVLSAAQAADWALRGPEAGDEGPEARATLAEVLRLCHDAGALLDAQAPAFDALRDLAGRCDVLRARLADRLAAAEARAAAAVSLTAELRSQWQRAGLAGAPLHLSQARELLAFAKGQLARVPGTAPARASAADVARLRAAEEALAQADALLGVVELAPAWLALAVEATAALLTEARASLSQAATLDLPPGAGATRAFTDDTVTWVGATITSGEFDPVATLRALEESEQALDRALAPLRDSAAELRRADALLPTSTAAADAVVLAAEAAIMARRAAVGAEARSRLARARRELIAAQEAPGAVPALPLIQGAGRLAEQAANLAQQDESAHVNARRLRGADTDTRREAAILAGVLVPSEVPEQWAVARFGGPATRTRLALPPG